MLCKCGKLWCASERDAREQVVLECRLKGKDSDRELARSRFYECDVEEGVWHWTRNAPWMDKKAYEESEKAKCNCPGKEPKFLSERQAVSFQKNLPKIEGLSVRSYKCRRGGRIVWHVEYFFKGDPFKVCDYCNRVTYNKGLSEHKTVLKGVRRAGTQQINTFICRRNKLHILNSVVEGKKK